MTSRCDDAARPLYQLRFLVALLLILPPLLAGFTLPRDLHGPAGRLLAGYLQVDYAAMDIILPFTAAVLVFPATRRRRLVGVTLGLLSLSAFHLVRIGNLYRLVLDGAVAFDLASASAEVAHVLMVTLAIVGFFAWVRWASHETR